MKNFQRKTKTSPKKNGKSGTYWEYHDGLVIPFFSFRALTCHHKGPCNQYTKCKCYNEQQRCQRMCSCSKDCKKRSLPFRMCSLTRQKFILKGSLKFKGCRCHSKRNQKLCTPTSGCPCVRLRRECNPELCLKCDARYALLH